MPAELGLGLAALGRPGYINLGHAQDLPSTDVAAMEAHCHDVLDAAWAAGVRYVDAARSYGRAEAFLASWLRARKIAPGQIYVASKWGYTYTANWQVKAEHHEVKDHSLAQLERQWPETQALLGPWLNLYQIHSATLESGVLDDIAVHARLRTLRDAGIAIGLTVSGPKQAETLERALALGLFDAVQATWNLLEPSAEPALVRAKQAGLRVVVKEALANGKLVRSLARLTPLVEAAVRLGTGTDAVALAAAMRKPWADVVLSGAATIEQLQSNLRAREVLAQWPPPLDAGLATLAKTSDAYWTARASLPWN
jgi:aryl-alcohol dehydrogenase-like predicted oxidoreductase